MTSPKAPDNNTINAALAVEELFEEWSKKFDGTTLSPLWGSEYIVARQAFLEAHRLATRATAEKIQKLVESVSLYGDARVISELIESEFLQDKGGGG